MNLSLLSRFQGCLQGAFLTSQAETLERLAALIPRLCFSRAWSLEDWQALTALDSSQPWVALIPLMLFYHDCPSAFYQQLQLFQRTQRLSHLDTAAIALIFQIISLVLRERFDPQLALPTNLARLSNVWKYGFESPELTEVINHLTTTMTRAIPGNDSLPQVREDPSLAQSGLARAIGLGLYCWLDTPDHFAISWRRANLIPNSLAVIFTGTLSGAYNGTIGMRTLASLTLPPQPLETLLGKLSQNLYYQWSGGLDPYTVIPKPVTTAPLVMQRRPGLKLISQCEYY